MITKVTYLTAHCEVYDYRKDKKEPRDAIQIRKVFVPIKDRGKGYATELIAEVMRTCGYTVLPVSPSGKNTDYHINSSKDGSPYIHFETSHPAMHAIAKKLGFRKVGVMYFKEEYLTIFEKI